MGLKIREIGPGDRATYQGRIRALEEGVTYPLGEDRFEIDHGEDYFAFFERLGELSYLAVLDGEEVVAAVAAVARRVPPSPGAPPRRAWYLCDLKVRPGHRGRRIPARLFAWALPRKYLACPRGYAISMNPGDGSENSVVRLLARFPVAPLSLGATLYLYSLDDGAMRAVRPVLEEARGPVSFLSLRDTKDIVLQSTHSPMPLLHVQFGPCGAEGDPEPEPGCVHMFCTPSEDPLVAKLREQGYAPSATAALVQHRMRDWDWRFVLTSDI